MLVSAAGVHWLKVMGTSKKIASVIDIMIFKRTLMRSRGLLMSTLKGCYFPISMLLFK